MVEMVLRLLAVSEDNGGSGGEGGKVGSTVLVLAINPAVIEHDSGDV